MHGGDGLEYLDCEEIETTATCTVGMDGLDRARKGKERKGKEREKSHQRREREREKEGKGKKETFCLLQ